MCRKEELMYRTVPYRTDLIIFYFLNLIFQLRIIKKFHLALVYLNRQWYRYNVPSWICEKNRFTLRTYVHILHKTYTASYHTLLEKFRKYAISTYTDVVGKLEVNWNVLLFFFIFVYFDRKQQFYVCQYYTYRTVPYLVHIDKNDWKVR